MQVITKIGSSVDVTYQAAGSTSGLADVIMKIYDETRALDGVNYPDVTMTEIDVTGRYYGNFTPDAVGVWTVVIDSVVKPGPVVQTFVVTNNDVDSIASAIAALNDISPGDVSTEVTSALGTYNAAKVTDVSGAESNIRGADSDTLKTLSDQVDGLGQQAMVG